MKKTSLLFVLIFTGSFAFSQSYFPPVAGNQWDSISPSSLNWCQPEIDSLLTYLEDENSRGFIVLKDGKIVIEEYFNGGGKDSLWIWYSAGKSLTSVLTGIAQQEGDLDINDKTSEYLGQGWTSLDTTQENLITIRNQLTMTSGLDEQATDYCTDDTCLIYKADAGTRWVYHNPPYTLLRDVVENATSTNYNVYTFQKLHQTIGFSGFWLPVGYNNFYFSDTRAMARFGLMVLNEGIWDGDTIIKDQSYVNAMSSSSQNLNLSYGYLWWLNGKASHIPPGLTSPLPWAITPDAPADMFAAAGAQGQFICIVPSLDIVLVRIGTDSSTSLVPTIFLNNIWKRFMRVLCTPTGIENAEERIYLKLFPNPVKDRLDVQINEVIEELSVLNAAGQLVQTETNSKSIYFSKNVESGIYLLKIKTKDNLYFRRFVKE